MRRTASCADFHCHRGCRRIVRPAALFACLFVVASAFAQGRPVVIENLKAIDREGNVLENLKVAIMQGRIGGVGEKVSVPLFAKKIDGGGKFVTSGFIDAWCAPDAYSSGRGAAISAADAFDPYNKYLLQSAWSQGIVAAYFTPRAGDSQAGTGVVVKYSGKNDPESWLANDAAAVCFQIDDNNGRAFQRLRSLKQFRDAIENARAYRVALEDYEEELKEYEERLAERAKKNAAEKDKKGDKSADSKDEKKDDKKNGDNKKKKKRKKKKDKPKGADDLSFDEPKPGDEDKKESKDESTADDKGKKKDKKKDDIKKPKKPPYDANLALIVRALDGELPVRVAVNRPEDISAVVEVAKDYALKLIIEGGAGAHRVAELLAENDVAVVLGPATETMFFAGGAREFQSADAAAILEKAGVDVYFGTGPLTPTGLVGTNLLMQVASAVGNGFPDDQALAVLNRKAIPFLNVEKKVGRIRPGAAADFVLWSDNPFAAGARVEAVYVDGREVYRAADEEGDS